ncbi:hypothetical protein [Argonema galeatum]|uniref:hypothetical protein n=1 Tax=Argonema galeatum TaxID=2942762 RepID=UPI0020113326|nr:hypothetical protein [Argonema galeatum]MCL1464218.1 hypothetical protein [Argonema galeatum A003/A1]
MPILVLLPRNNSDAATKPIIIWLFRSYLDFKIASHYLANQPQFKSFTSHFHFSVSSRVVQRDFLNLPLNGFGHRKMMPRIQGHARCRFLPIAVNHLSQPLLV